MSTPQASMTQCQDTTPPTSFSKSPLTPPPTDEKRFPQVQRILVFFENIRAGKRSKTQAEVEFELLEGEYNELNRRLQLKEELSGYVKDKIRYDYNEETNRLVVRMPSEIHELFIDGVEDAIRSQLKAIRSGSGPAARFAQKVRPARSTIVEIPSGDLSSGRKSRYEPDASFWHEDAQFPGVIIEVAYSQEKKRLCRLAEDYLLDSDANIRAVVGLDIEYGKTDSRKATLSIWRANLLHTAGGNELRVTPEIEDEAFRDDHGNPTDRPGLRLQLSDFANRGLVQKEVGDLDNELTISAQQLCELLNAAEAKICRKGSLSKDSIPFGVRKRKRTATPPEEMASGDEARYVEQEERAAKRMANDDPDYENI